MARVLALVRQLVDDQVEPLALDELHGVEDARRPRGRPRRPARYWCGAAAPRPWPRGGTAPAPCGRWPRGPAGLERDPAAERDLLGLVHDPHPAAADLAHHPVVAHLRERRRRLASSRLRLGASQHFLGLLDLHQRREQLADLVGHRRAAVDVFLQARPLAAAIPLGELLGQLVKSSP